MALNTIADLQPHLDALKVSIDALPAAAPAIDLQPVADQIDTLKAEVDAKSAPAP